MLTSEADVHPRLQRKTKEVFIKIKPLDTVYSDQTGTFPYLSSRGFRYIMIVYDYDMNAILSLPLRSKSGSEQLSAITRLHDQLSDQGQDTFLHILDNEASLCVMSYLNLKRITYQLVPPNVHRRNAAERDISTWKDHFVSGLCSTDPSFPMHLWDRLYRNAIILST